MDRDVAGGDDVDHADGIMFFGERGLLATTVDDDIACQRLADGFGRGGGSLVLGRGLGDRGGAGYA